MFAKYPTTANLILVTLLVATVLTGCGEDSSDTTLSPVEAPTDSYLDDIGEAYIIRATEDAGSSATSLRIYRNGEWEIVCLPNSHEGVEEKLVNSTETWKEIKMVGGSRLMDIDMSWGYIGIHLCDEGGPCERVDCWSDYTVCYKCGCGEASR